MITYTVKDKDTISKIAVNHGVTVSAIKNANPNIKNINKIYVGQKIKIPVDTDTAFEKAFKKCVQDIQNLQSFKKLMNLLE